MVEYIQQVWGHHKFNVKLREDGSSYHPDIYIALQLNITWYQIYKIPPKLYQIYKIPPSENDSEIIDLGNPYISAVSNFASLSFFATSLG